MRIPVILAALVVAVSAHANPKGANEEMARFTADQGMLARVDQIRQNVSEKASNLVLTSLGFLGIPYRRGGNTAETGFDCSGFVKAMYQQTIGLILPRRAEQQAATTKTIARSELQPGDLVFFNTLRRAFSHVGIYLGDGKFIHSPKPGAEVRVENMHLRYWESRFDGARRVQGEPAEASSTQAEPSADHSPR